MHHKGTGCECVNWIHVIQDNDGHNNLLSCCTENRGFLGNQDSVFKDVLCCTWLFGLSYILESNPQLVFADFLNEKKKLVRGSNPHLSFNCPLPTRQTD